MVKWILDAMQSEIGVLFWFVDCKVDINRRAEWKDADFKCGYLWQLMYQLVLRYLRDQFLVKRQPCCRDTDNSLLSELLAEFLQFGATANHSVIGFLQMLAIMQPG